MDHSIPFCCREEGLPETPPFLPLFKGAAQSDDDDYVEWRINTMWNPLNFPVAGSHRNCPSHSQQV